MTELPARLQVRLCVTAVQWLGPVVLEIEASALPCNNRSMSGREYAACDCMPMFRKSLSAAGVVQLQLYVRIARNSPGHSGGIAQNTRCRFMMPMHSLHCKRRARSRIVSHAHAHA